MCVFRSIIAIMSTLFGKSSKSKQRNKKRNRDDDNNYHRSSSNNDHNDDVKDVNDDINDGILQHPSTNDENPYNNNTDQITNNKNQQQSNNNISDTTNPSFFHSTFHTIGLAQPLIETCYQLGFKKPTPVQRTVIPYLLNDRINNVLVLAETGMLSFVYVYLFIYFFFFSLFVCSYLFRFFLYTRFW